MKSLRISLAFFLYCAVGPAAADEGATWLFVSAPIFPKVCPDYDAPTCASGLYGHQGASYPTTPEGQRQLVQDASATFEELLTACHERNPEIVLRAPSEPALSQEQLAINFVEAALCANERYGVRPVWIPQLVDDVDVCEMKMGPGWHMPREAELSSLTDEDRLFLKNTLTAADDAGVGGLYFSLTIYVRADDGTLKLGTLEAGQSPQVWELPIPPEERTYAGYGGGHSAYTTAALRCVLTTQTL